MKTILVCILSIISFGMMAQEENNRAFKAGLVLGFNASQLDGDRFRGYSKLGINAGLKVKYPFPNKPKLGLAVEMLYSMKGSSSDLNFSSNNNNQVKIKLDYIEIPVLVSYTEWKLDFEAGLSYGRLINASTSILTTGYLEDDFRKNEANVLLGATYLINDHIGATFRYTRSFTNAVRKDVNRDALLGHLITFRIEYLF